MKKKIQILFIIMLMTGCSVDYKLEVKNSGIVETGAAIFSLEELNGKSTKQMINQLIPKYFINDDILIGEKTDYIRKGSDMGYQIKNEYLLTELNDIPTLTYCYNNVLTENTKKKISMNTSNEFLCFNYYEELDNVTIHINSKLKNISNNADNIKGNDYYWYITKDNCHSKEISFSFEKNNTSFFSKEVLILFGSIFAILTIAVIIIMKKENKNNEI